MSKTIMSNSTRIIVVVFLFSLMFNVCLIISSYAELNDFEVAEALLFQDPQMADIAYPLAGSYALTLDSYDGYRTFIKKFPKAPQQADMRKKALDKARIIHTEIVYDDFIALIGDGTLTLQAIKEEFKVFQAIDTISEYERFIRKFPNTSQAVVAMERIYQIAFDRAKRADRVTVYDQYIRNFPYAPKLTQVLQLAKKAEERDLKRELQTIGNLGSFVERKEAVARRIYNEGRQAELRRDMILIDRKYSLLENLFSDTKAYTELLDRKEELTYRQEMKTYQEGILREIKGVQESLNQIERSIDYLSGDIQRSLQTQTAAMQRAQREAQWQAEQERQAMDELYQKTQEDARLRDFENRRCAEILRKDGRYGWFSGCK